MSHKRCLSITKYFLFIFNLMFFILGILLLSFGLWILFDRKSFVAILGASSHALKVWSYIFCGVGILTMLMGFLGCLGSLKEIKCMLGFYFAFLLLLFISQISIGILVYVQRNTLTKKTGEYVEDIIASYGTIVPILDRDESLDFVQEQFQCCGWVSPDDWKQNTVLQKNASFLYPCSCHATSELGTNNTGTSKLPEGSFCSYQEKWPVHSQGCMNRVQSWLFENIFNIVGICLGISLLEFLALVLISMLEPRTLHSGGFLEILDFHRRWNLCLMTLSMFLCRTIGPDYDKLARYS